VHAESAAVARKREARRGDERLAADECTATSFAGAGDG
jgi:hypothetical protein